MRIAVLVKQIPAFERMTLGPDGRLVRDGVALELNAYCRRAVSKAVELAEEREGSSVTVITLGPPPAEDALREALAWGLERGVTIDGLLVSDPAFAGSDTLATALALAAALEQSGPYDLILTGLNSLDADTGQVPPQVAELLDLPFAAGVRRLELEGDSLQLTCEHDDASEEVTVSLPALLSCAERLTEPSKVDPPGRAAVSASLIRRISAGELGPGPWGQAGSPTWVGTTRTLTVDRGCELQPEAPLAEQVEAAVRVLTDRKALDASAIRTGVRSVAATGGAGAIVAVIGESGRDGLLRQLLGAAAELAERVGGSTLAFTSGATDGALLGSWGADRVVAFEGEATAEDVPGAIAGYLAGNAIEPWAILVGSTAWGREVGGRLAVRLSAGLIGDAISLEVGEDERLVGWKPAFGGQIVAAITATSVTQMATVRAGVLPDLAPRGGSAAVEAAPIAARGRVLLKSASRHDDLDSLARAEVVIGVGAGVAPSEYGELKTLADLLGAELAATRKVTDKGWMPRSRQVGITGRTIQPRLYIAIGIGGKFNHTVGIRTAETVLAINNDPGAAIWQSANAGIVGDWREALPLLVAALQAARVPAPA